MRTHEFRFLMLLPIFAVGCVALLASTAGCVHETAGTIVTLDTDTSGATIVEGSMRLRNRVKVTKVSYDEVNGLKRATFTLESTRHARQSIQARIIWLTAEGMEIDASAKSYRSIILSGLDSTTVTGVAPNTSAVTARLRVRELSAADND